MTRITAWNESLTESLIIKLLKKGIYILTKLKIIIPFFLIYKTLSLNRNILSKTCITLKTLIEELIKYFIICEEEVNNTFITEVIKRQLSDSVNNEGTVQSDKSRKNQEADLINFSDMRVQRVHLAPKTAEIASIINSNIETLPTILEEDESITERLKLELNNCIRRLKSESSEILTISSSTGEGRRDSPLKDTLWLNKMNEELNLKLHDTETLVIGYQEQINHLKMTILDLQNKLINAENKKETITEGYGENYDLGTDITLQDFSQLQEKGTKRTL